MNTVRKSATGMCPKCRSICNFVVSIERQQTGTQDGTVKAVEIVATHCETCGSFISRESREVAEHES